MWQEVTGHRFREMEDLILTYQREIGGSVCALTVKMNAWQDSKGRSNLAHRETFIMSDMVRGIEPHQRHKLRQVSLTRSGPIPPKKN